MTNKELRNLSRKELLEMLIEQAKETEELREKVKKLESDLASRRITISEAGSLAEAVLKVNNIFADADKAAEQYIENARRNSENTARVLAEAKKEAERIIASAEKKKNRMIEEEAYNVEKAKYAELIYPNKK